MMAHDCLWLATKGCVHQQEVTVPAACLKPSGLRDEYAATQTANFSMPHRPFDDPGRQPRRHGLGQIEHGSQVREHGGDIDHAPTVA